MVLAFFALPLAIGAGGEEALRFAAPVGFFGGIAVLESRVKRRGAAGLIGANPNGLETM